MRGEVNDYQTVAGGEDYVEPVVVKVPSKFAKSAFKQERLKPIGKPVYSDLVMLLVFLGAGCICIAGCGYLAYQHLYYWEISVDYTHCKSTTGNICADLIAKDKSKVHVRDGDKIPDCTCTVRFKVENDIKAPVGLYIRFSNFFQDHRLYVAAIDESQLKGRIYDKKLKTPIKPNEDCRIFDDDYELDKDGKSVFPCGAGAYSYFSDQIHLFKVDSSNKNVEVALKNKGIAWKSDVEYNFKNPEGFTKEYKDAPVWFNQHFKKPASWRQSTFEDWWKNGALENEDFINWMRASYPSKPVKLFRMVDVSKMKCSHFNGLCKGTYEVQINYAFDVTSFFGTKTLVFRTVRDFGSRNDALIYIFACIAIIAFLLAPFLFCSFPNRRQILNSDDDHLMREPTNFEDAQNEGEIDREDVLVIT